MRLVQDAMTHYFARKGAYPCPAAPVSDNPGDTQYYDCTTSDAVQIEHAEQHGIVFINSNGREIIEGAVPYRLLNIPREGAVDGWDNEFTYAVTAESTSHDTFNANLGGIGIVDENGTSLIDPPASAIWALVSHGPDGSGAYHVGAAIAKVCPPNRRETVNCSHDGQFVVAPRAFADSMSYYDDIVFYRTWVDYPLDSSSETYCMISLQKGSPRPSLVQEGAMIEICGDAAQALTKNSQDCQFMICRGGQLVPGIIDLGN